MACELAVEKPLRRLKIIKQIILEQLDGLPEESTHCALLASNTLREGVLPKLLFCDHKTFKGRR